MAPELLPRTRQAAPFIPKIFPMNVAGGFRVGVASSGDFDPKKVGPGHALAIYPGPPAVTVAWRASRSAEPSCLLDTDCPRFGGRAHGRCRKRFGSSIDGSPFRGGGAGFSHRPLVHLPSTPAALEFAETSISRVLGGCPQIPPSRPIERVFKATVYRASRVRW